MTWIVVGASSGVGRALAEAFAAQNESLVLVARDVRDLDAIAADLRVRFGATVRLCVADAAVPEALCAQLTSLVPPDVERVTGIAFPIGAVSETDAIERLPASDERLIDVNFRCVVHIVRAYLPRMLELGAGTLIGFGSIAAVRGRASNPIYAASKAALRTFFESLRHASERRGVVVQFYILGYIDTSLAFGRTLRFRKESPAGVARRVVRDLRRGGGTWYLPRFWKVIATAVRILPWTVFKRLQF